MKTYLLNNPQVVVTLIIGFFTLIIAWWFNHNNLKISKQKMEKELFKEFNERYDTLNDSLELITDQMTIDELKLTNSAIENKTLHNVVIDYFNLCAEQYYWKDKKRISNKIWLAWNKGMMYYFEKFPVIKELWKDEIKNEKYKSYYLKKDENFFQNF